ncbi:unnamed protein product [Thlaspi arvense]|uniref:HMA domain-containing protein n=1 Tax=Thlaspi arvense TaxID=13288 RepID=A0AAU9ST10_THLAR|nr:unnamed protein product [Thlaspi arvense]
MQFEVFDKSIKQEAIEVVASKFPGVITSIDVNEEEGKLKVTGEFDKLEMMKELRKIDENVEMIDEHGTPKKNNPKWEEFLNEDLKREKASEPILAAPSSQQRSPEESTVLCQALPAKTFERTLEIDSCRGVDNLGSSSRIRTRTKTNKKWILTNGSQRTQVTCMPIGIRIIRMRTLPNMEKKGETTKGLAQGSSRTRCTGSSSDTIKRTRHYNHANTTKRSQYIHGRPKSYINTTKEIAISCIAKEERHINSVL